MPLARLFSLLLLGLQALPGFRGTAARGAETGSPTYERPGTPAVGGVSQMCLIYHGNRSRLAWTPEMILPYVAHVDERGQPTDWLFDSFLFMEFVTDAGASLHHYSATGVQATAADWAWLADDWFREKTGLAGLEGAVEQAGGVLGQTNHVVNVVIALPMPFRPVQRFGPLPGSQAVLDFRQDADRLQALRWYLRRVLDHWQEAHYRHLHLAGFYWTDETIPPQNEDLVRATGKEIHALGYKLFWIPFFSPQGLDRWQQLGIDGTMLQPNYFFHPEVAPDRFLAVAQKARAARCGVEMEFDPRVFNSPAWADRFWAYLDAGVQYGWMTNSLLGYYEGGRGLRQLVDSGGAPGRQMYDALYRFVRGTYRPSGRTHLPAYRPLDTPVPDRSGNLALAARGAKVLGGERPAGEPELAPENAIDGIIDNYGGQGGFAYFRVPGSLTVELPQVATVARTQVLLWALDDRWFQYRMETSLDNEHWKLAVDKSRGQWTGWQVDTFAPRAARFVRLTGLHDSRSANFQVVEFEVYADAAGTNGGRR